MKRELGALQAALKEKVARKEPITDKEQNQLKNLFEEYQASVSAEKAAKGEKHMENNKITRGKFNAALKAFLRGDRLQ